MNKKHALLIAGGGTLGGYTYPELLKMGWQVDILDMLPRTSYNLNMRWIQGKADDILLKRLFSENHYNTIIDFLHYTDPAQYRERGMFLLNHTDQLIFLSSYRVYANDGKIVTENTPQLLDTEKDEYFLQHETYAVPKSWNERFLRSCGKTNWTIIRPMISFSSYRLDLVCTGAPVFFLRAMEGKKTILPADARYLNAGVGWAGNVGRMIARLCGNPRAFGEAFTLGAGEEQTWNDVAEMYTDMIGAEYEWVSTEDYLKYGTPNTYMDRCMAFYDRLFNRKVDISKVLEVTGIPRESLVSTRDGIISELDSLASRPELLTRFDLEPYQAVNKIMDEFLSTHGK